MAANWKLFLCLMIACIVFSAGCIEFKNPYDQLPPGEWRGVLYLDQQTTFRPGVERSQSPGDYKPGIQDNQLPFNFEVRYTEDGEMHVLFINGEDEHKVTDIKMGTDLSIAKDTITMRFPGSDNYLKAIYAENILQGFWVVPSRGNYQIPFEAHYGKNHRFELPVNRDIEKVVNVDGQWSVTLSPGEESERPAIAEFQQQGEKLQGSFITNTGDYRYLEGVVEGDKIWLSGFDGVFAFLLGAVKGEDERLEGFFRSGRHYQTAWTATQKDTVELKDPLAMSEFLQEQFSFTVSDAAGAEITEKDHLGRPTLIYLTGTWCPNCRDASLLLKELGEKHDIQIIGLSFERYRDREKALKMIDTYTSDLNLPYPIYLAGYFDKKEATENLGLIEEIIAYPTVVFLKPDFTISGSYTGFSGPATSRYPELVQAFEEEIKKITAGEISTD